MFQRQRTGSLLCPSCGRLVGVSEKQCPYCGRRNPGMWGMTSWMSKLGRDFGFVEVVIGGCVLVYLLTLVADPSGIQMSGIFNLLGPSELSLLRFGASGAAPILDHRWWTLLSAGWLHAGILHIGFNLYWVRFLAPAIAEFYGPSRMVIIYTVSCISGFLLSSLIPLLRIGALGGGVVSVGASAPILGLVGALVYYGRRGGSRSISTQAWSFAASVLVFGLLMRGVDNWAHIGGFIGGYLTGRLLDPLRPESGTTSDATIEATLSARQTIAIAWWLPRSGRRGSSRRPVR
jgi:rhomboid protease GluP